MLETLSKMMLETGVKPFTETNNQLLTYRNHHQHTVDHDVMVRTNHHRLLEKPEIIASSSNHIYLYYYYYCYYELVIVNSRE
jgi:hypothetical protein